MTPYYCPGCNTVVWRESQVTRLHGFCSASGKNVTLRRMPQWWIREYEEEADNA